MVIRLKYKLKFKNTDLHNEVVMQRCRISRVYLGD